MVFSVFRFFRFSGFRVFGVWGYVFFGSPDNAVTLGRKGPKGGVIQRSEDRELPSSALQRVVGFFKVLSTRFFEGLGFFKALS